MDKIITVPFGYLLDWLYRFTGSYGLALIFFALAVQIVLLPITAKSKKSTMKMSRLQPKIQEIQRKYPNDRQKQNEAMQQLQKEEGASMGCGGCLWSLIPLLILLPLYSVVRQPITYMLHQSAEVADAIIEIIKAGLTNASFKFSLHDVEYVYRHPGGTADNLIDRRTEVYTQNMAKEYGLDKSLIYIDPSGWKVSYFIQNIIPCTILENEMHLQQVIDALHKTHEIPLSEEAKIT